MPGAPDPARAGCRLGNASRIRLGCEVPVLRDELAGDERRALRIGNYGHPDPGGVERRGGPLPPPPAPLSGGGAPTPAPQLPPPGGGAARGCARDRVSRRPPAPEPPG